MTYKSFVILLLLSVTFAFGQTKGEKRIISNATVDKNIADTLTFNTLWDYPWYIIIDENGNIENTLNDSITKSDTTPLFHTANCYSNHQGEHQIRYCMAKRDQDNIRLIFMPELPAYGGTLTITLIKGHFWSDFHTVYPSFNQNTKRSWSITKQKMILNESAYNPGDLVKGYIDIKFTETVETPDSKPVTKHYYFRGYFITPLTDNK